MVQISDEETKAEEKKDEEEGRTKNRRGFCGLAGGHCDCSRAGLQCEPLICGCDVSVCRNPFGCKAKANTTHVKDILNKLKKTEQLFL